MDMFKLFQDIKTYIQDLQASQRMTIVEVDRLKEEVARNKDEMTKSIDMLRNSTTMAHAATTALAGTFSSIEQIFVDHEKRISALEKKPPAA